MGNHRTAVLLAMLLVLSFAGTAGAEETFMGETVIPSVAGPSLLAAPHAKALNGINDSLTKVGKQLERTAAGNVVEGENTRDNDDTRTNHEVVEAGERSNNEQSDRLHLATIDTKTSASEVGEAIGMGANAMHLTRFIVPAVLGPFAQKLYTSSRAKGALGNLTMVLTAACRYGTASQEQAQSLGRLVHQGCSSSRRVAGSLFGGVGVLRKNGQIRVSASGGAMGYNLRSIKNLLAQSGVAKNPSRLFAFSVAGGGGGNEDTRALGIHIAASCIGPDAPQDERADRSTGIQEFVPSARAEACLGRKVAGVQAEMGGDAAPSTQDLKVADIIMFQHNGKQLARLIAAGGGGGMYDGLARACAEKGYNDLQKDLGEGFVPPSHVKACQRQAVQRSAELALGDGNGTQGNQNMLTANNAGFTAEARLEETATAGLSGGSDAISTDNMVSLMQTKEFKQFVESGEFAKLAGVYWNELDKIMDEASMLAQQNIRDLNIPAMIPSFYAGNYVQNEQRYLASLDKERKKMSLNDYFIEFDSDTAMNLPTPDVIRYAGVLNLFQNKYLYNSDGETLIASIEDKPSITVAQSQTTWDMVFGKTGSQLLAEFKQKGEPVDADTVVSERGPAPAPKTVVVSKLEQPAPAHAFKAMPIAALIRY